MLAFTYRCLPPAKPNNLFAKIVELSTAVAASLKTTRDSRFMQPVRKQHIPVGANVKRLKLDQNKASVKGFLRRVSYFLNGLLAAKARSASA